MDNQPPVELRLLRRTELVEVSLSKYRNEGNENLIIDNGQLASLN